ncbi:MAG: phenylacetate--CoA ligase family protein [Pelotomaculum sp.]
MKRIMANMEAIRRDYYRRYKGYKELMSIIDYQYVMESGDFSRRNKKISDLIQSVQKKVPAYKGKEFCNLEDFPLISKKDIRDNYSSYLSENLDIRQCFKSHTSGSTGTPFYFYRHRDAVMLDQVFKDKFFEYAGSSIYKNKVRISGINIIPFYIEDPPFWVYIDKYKQLQCSAYHVNDKTAKVYCDAMFKYEVEYGTGYAKTWLFLADGIRKSNLHPPKLKFIVTDSEGITKSQQLFVESVFNCPVYQTYGLSEVAQIAVQCRKGNYHIIPDLTFVEILPFDQYDGQDDVGEIVITTLTTDQTPLIRYRTGDLGKLGIGECGCGIKTQYLTKLIGRTDDYIIVNGRKISRLGHIVASSEGIVASQIIQLDDSHIVIRLIPDKSFSQSTVEKIRENAKPYIGNLNIKFETSKDLERDKSGKIKYIIRKFD